MKYVVQFTKTIEQVASVTVETDGGEQLAIAIAESCLALGEGESVEAQRGETDITVDRVH